MPARKARGTTRFLECRYIRSSFSFPNAIPTPECAELLGIPLLRCVERRETAAIEFNLRAPMYRRNALRSEMPDSVGNLVGIVVDESIGQAHRVSLLSAMNCPNECAITRVEFFHPVLLFDHLGTVHSESSFACHNHIAGKSCSERHSPEAANRAGGETDHRGMFSQCQNGGHELGNCRQAKIGLLQTHAAGLEQNHRAGRYTFLVVGTGQIESGSHLFAGNLSHAAALKGALERNNDCCLPGNFSFHHHTAIICLWRDALHRQPGRFHAIEGAKQLARCSRIEERRGPLPCVEFDKALPVDEVCVISLVAHRSLTSAACSRRSWTLPGVAPASLI